MDGVATCEALHRCNQFNKPGLSLHVLFSIGKCFVFFLVFFFVVVVPVKCDFISDELLSGKWSKMSVFSLPLSVLKEKYRSLSGVMGFIRACSNDCRCAALLYSYVLSMDNTGNESSTKSTMFLPTTVY